MLPLTSFAKVDFHSMINEGAKQQELVRKDFVDNVGEIKVEKRKAGEIKYMVDNDTNTIVVPTKKDMLEFEKERAYYRASKVKQVERLASEVDEANF